ncbi:fatty acid-binding protein-like [Epargyreus clarus]|uniref:fatty acid-binding protein-like n=1 Tax=Epargyreus clarus TaxID=520877 RepID=UPI003C2B3309
MDSFLGKKYKLKASDNFEEYLKFIEIGYLSRKTALALSPTSILIKNIDGSYTFTMSNGFRSTVNTFRLGEEFTEERADGVLVKSIMTMEGNKLIQVQIEDNGRKSTHVREYTEKTLTVTSTGEGWEGKSIRVYVLVK